MGRNPTTRRVAFAACCACEACLLLASLIVPGLLFEALGVRPASGCDTLALGMRLIMVIGIAFVPLAYVVLSRLRAILDTVRDGDPFVAANARRLQTIAWAYLGLELLHLGVGVVAASSGSSAQPLDVLQRKRWGRGSD
jgi:hypothetical protein